MKYIIATPAPGEILQRNTVLQSDDLGVLVNQPLLGKRPHEDDLEVQQQVKEGRIVETEMVCIALCCTHKHTDRRSNIGVDSDSI